MAMIATRIRRKGMEVVGAELEHADSSAFEQLHRLHEPGIRRHALLLTGHRDEAEDLVQETFVRAFRAFASLKDPAAAPAWLMRICTNAYRERCRSQARRPEAPWSSVQGSDREADGSDPASDLEQQELLVFCRNTLGSLNPEDRALVVLYAVDGRSYDEIAAIAGGTRPGVKMRVWRAMQRLRRAALAALIDGDGK